MGILTDFHVSGHTTYQPAYYLDSNYIPSIKLSFILVYGLVIQEFGAVSFLCTYWPYKFQVFLLS